MLQVHAVVIHGFLFGSDSCKTNQQKLIRFVVADNSELWFMLNFVALISSVLVLYLAYRKMYLQITEFYVFC